MHMNPIVIIALIVVALAVAFYFIRLGMDKRKQENAAIHRSIADQERVNRMADRMDDDPTKTWPGPPAAV